MVCLVPVVTVWRPNCWLMGSHSQVSGRSILIIGPKCLRWFVYMTDDPLPPPPLPPRLSPFQETIGDIVA